MKTLTFVTKVFLFAILFNTTIQAQEHRGALTSNGSLYFRAEPVNNYINENKKDGDVYYYIHLQGIKKEENTDSKRVPLNLSLVLDRSGSMNGEKLNNVKKAVAYIIKQMSSTDILSIVFYDTDVNVLLEPQRLEDKETIIKKVNEINSGSSTNLEGGIKMGYELIKNSKKLVNGEMINRVLLLSDGLANVGISDPVQLGNFTSSCFEKDGISISTFGVGLDYNEDLMAKIASLGGGMYYFISSPEKLSDIFNMELKGISKVVAKNTKLEITFPGDLLEYNKTYAYNGVLNDNILTVYFNDIFSEEQKAILVKFKIKQKTDSLLKIECKLSYSNSAKDSLIDLTFREKSEIHISKNDNEYKSGFNKAASEGYALHITGEIFEEAVQAAKNEEYKISHEKIKEAKDILDNHFKYIGDNNYLKSIYQNLSDYEKIIDDLKKMDKEKISFHIKHYKESRYISVKRPCFY